MKWITDGSFSISCKVAVSELGSSSQPGILLCYVPTLGWKKQQKIAMLNIKKKKQNPNKKKSNKTK